MTYQKPTLLLKGCPKCGGDLTVARDIHGRYVSCLQCGLLKDIEEVSLPVQPAIRVAPVPQRKAA